MSKEFNKKIYPYILALHSTYHHFGFALRDLSKTHNQEKYFTKKFDRDLSNNLIYDLGEFLKGKELQSIKRIAISIGPSNFNASRLITTCARTISQQIKCDLDIYSSFFLIAKRLLIKNKLKKNEQFWIFKELRSRGYIVGKYETTYKINKITELEIKELIKPKLYQYFLIKNNIYDAKFNIEEELKELLKLSYRNHEESITSPWKNALPIYPISAIN